MKSVEMFTTEFFMEGIFINHVYFSIGKHEPEKSSENM